MSLVRVTMINNFKYIANINAPNKLIFMGKNDKILGVLLKF